MAAASRAARAARPANALIKRDAGMRVSRACRAPCATTHATAAGRLNVATTLCNLERHHAFSHLLRGNPVSSHPPPPPPVHALAKIQSDGDARPIELIRKIRIVLCDLPNQGRDRFT